MNATIAWVITAVLVILAVLGFFAGLLVFMTIAAVAAFVAITPAVVNRSWTRTVSWPLLLLASIPLVLGVGRPSFFSDVVTSLSIAMLAMLVVVALQMTTTVRMTPRFAIFFVALSTMAFAGFWAVGSAISARYLGTDFVETNEELMIVFTAAALAGIAGGVIFRWYFRGQLKANVEAQPDVEVVA
ncbi:hypothetical protein GJR96_16605 [Haloferax sp. MBLA0076]|uniref:Uncharacterized protein n=1 Tax=Haloferax litoreum TaxID=2666140 RepID=A0A6A8GKM0_9EURY|nr:hypothetical protein Hfx1148_16550 [Haloferax sp. CBA1148]MRX23566.1 hypothetical protein [Haloferax litoreum]